MHVATSKMVQKDLRNFISEPPKDGIVHSTELVKKYNLNDDTLTFMNAVSPINVVDEFKSDSIKLDSIVITDESRHDNLPPLQTMKSINFLAESGFCFFIDFNRYNHIVDKRKKRRAYTDNAMD